MGIVIALEDARRRGAAGGIRAAGAPAAAPTPAVAGPPALPAPGAPAPRTEFYFQLACPFSYLAAEQVERSLGTVEWIPVLLERASAGWAGDALLRDRAEVAARRLRLPLSWPDCAPAGFPSATRAAMYAAESGAGSAFALAALRFAFSGGYDLEEREILAEAAAAAGVDPGRALAAARRMRRNGALEDVSRHLAAHGIDRLPAVRVGERWFSGERAVSEAAAYRHAIAVRRLAPSA
jgi:2-hydroxychromene-2-carboxylate isomerase